MLLLHVNAVVIFLMRQLFRVLQPARLVLRVCVMAPASHIHRSISDSGYKWRIVVATIVQADTSTLSRRGRISIKASQALLVLLYHISQLIS